jgi:hypothetical protein
MSDTFLEQHFTPTERRSIRAAAREVAQRQLQAQRHLARNRYRAGTKQVAGISELGLTELEVRAGVQRLDLEHAAINSALEAGGDVRATVRATKAKAIVTHDPKGEAAVIDRLAEMAAALPPTLIGKLAAELKEARQRAARREADIFTVGMIVVVPTLTIPYPPRAGIAMVVARNKATVTIEYQDGARERRRVSPAYLEAPKQTVMPRNAIDEQALIAHRRRQLFPTEGAR